MIDLTDKSETALSSLVFALPCLNRARNSVRLMYLIDSRYIYTPVQEYVLKRDLWRAKRWT